MNPLLVAGSVGLDWLIGDPRWLPHPVVGMGRIIAWWEKKLWSPHPRVAFASGLLLTAGLVVGVFAIAWFLLMHLAVAWAPLAWGTAVLLGAQALAARDLTAEARSVVRRVEENDLPGARRRLSRIVGRDTADLSREEILRATTESVAESACDGVIAPLVYLMLGGVPLAMAYKAANTLDSMIGHRTPRHEYFGKCAARLDDLLNFVPARLTAFLLAAAGFFLRLDAANALRVAIQQGCRHASLNAGYPEAAAAGALAVRLGGPVRYAGEWVDRPWLVGGDRPLAPADVQSIVRAMYLAEILALALGAFVAGGPL